MLENFQGDSWGSIPPLCMPSLLPHDLCHGRRLLAVIEFQLSYSRSWKMMLWKVLHSICNMQYAGSQQPSAVILEPRKIKSDTVSTVFPSISHEVMGPDAMILVFWMLSLSQLFHSPLSLSSRGSLVLLGFLPWGWCHLHIWDYWYLSQQSWFQFVLLPDQRFSWCTLHRS